MAARYHGEWATEKEAEGDPASHFEGLSFGTEAHQLYSCIEFMRTGETRPLVPQNKPGYDAEAAAAASREASRLAQKNDAAAMEQQHARLEVAKAEKSQQDANQTIAAAIKGASFTCRQAIEAKVAAVQE